MGYRRKTFNPTKRSKILPMEFFILQMISDKKNKLNAKIAHFGQFFCFGFGGLVNSTQTHERYIN
jgi:hypothetical protein